MCLRFVFLRAGPGSAAAWPGEGRRDREGPSSCRRSRMDGSAAFGVLPAMAGQRSLDRPGVQAPPELPGDGPGQGGWPEGGIGRQLLFGPDQDLAGELVAAADPGRAAGRRAWPARPSAANRTASGVARSSPAARSPRAKGRAAARLTHPGGVCGPEQCHLPGHLIPASTEVVVLILYTSALGGASCPGQRRVSCISGPRPGGSSLVSASRRMTPAKSTSGRLANAAYRARLRHPRQWTMTRHRSSHPIVYQHCGMGGLNEPVIPGVSI
jgi:hypothetical protein